MYTQKRNGQVYTFLPIEPPQPSSFYHYHYPDDAQENQPAEESSILTARRYLFKFDILSSFTVFILLANVITVISHSTYFKKMENIFVYVFNLCLMFTFDYLYIRECD